MEPNPGRSLYGTSRRRICTGACPFFAPEYLGGRKLAGLGSCLKHGSEAEVTVGTLCLWHRDSAPQAVAAAMPQVIHLVPAVSQPLAS